LFCNSAAAAGYGTRKDTLTVSFHTILPSETFGLAVFLTVWYNDKALQNYIRLHQITSDYIVYGGTAWVDFPTSCLPVTLTIR
ncbi:hypothetical protein, partial [Faecousia sp.]|uniref:hypothetical protein n=1 Tax=Faecousia sp. TaxID=2952921 RepID=UPI003AB31CC1